MDTPRVTAVKHAPGLRRLTTSGVADLLNGLRSYDLWGRLGFIEVKRRYRRTLFGPFWNSISLGAFIAVMGTVGLGLWNRDASEYLPFLAAGLMIWVMISAIITESCMVFIAGHHLFSRVRIDFSVLAYALVWRNLLTFLHNLLIYVVVILLFAPKLVTWATLLVIPGLLLVAVNALWVALLVGMTCLRFRDVHQLILTLLQVSLFITPILWPPELLKNATALIFVDLNPLYCFVDVVRSPLIGKIPAAGSYYLALALTVLGWAAVTMLFSKFRKRIAFWV
jgi:ABC-type polysaccharide/polyol phosphate export permease